MTINSNEDGRRFSEMFPDSVIARKLKENEIKVKYIQYGIFPYLKGS